MSGIYGRWDLLVGEGEAAFPSWVEIQEGGGSFVGRFGSARPLHRLIVEDHWTTFSLPKQYESRSTDMVFYADLRDSKLVGTTVLDDGTEADWIGVRAPELPGRQHQPGTETSLIGADLSNWLPRSPAWTNQWSIREGHLTNAGVGTDLVSRETFQDFRLVAEYSYPAQSNSGIYLRGRYEFQILDDFDSGRSDVGNSGAIYGFIAPTKNAILPAGEWNRVEITLVGRFIHVVLNGETIIDNVEIPGITGGALDSREELPGPILLQGDHGPVTFRVLNITPL